ncbi:MAG TPA: DUF2917 domain-containing protein [Verrucomicrobiae bacterium]|nr:DUF2917 domain-containing protein [Verrucomicrobiae bacterium]
MNALIHPATGLGSVVPRRPAMVGLAANGLETVSLPREKIFRLEKNSGVISIEIASGVVWLTGTPADGDVLLSSGERFTLPNTRPFVIQALEPAEFSLR